jgi:hypothetical protein
MASRASKTLATMAPSTGEDICQVGEADSVDVLNTSAALGGIKRREWGRRWANADCSKMRK